MVFILLFTWLDNILLYVTPCLYSLPDTNKTKNKESNHLAFLAKLGRYLLGLQLRALNWCQHGLTLKTMTLNPFDPVRNFPDLLLLLLVWNYPDLLLLLLVWNYPDLLLLLLVWNYPDLLLLLLVWNYPDLLPVSMTLVFDHLDLLSPPLMWD